VKEISARELAVRMSHSAPALLDVREPWEYELCHLPGSLLIPLDQLPARVAELPEDRPLIVICHHGVRSLMAQQFLSRLGLVDVYNLTGGIAAWAHEIDPDMAVY